LSTSRQLADTNDRKVYQQSGLYERSIASDHVYVQNNGQTLGTLVLTLTRDELCSYVDARIVGLAETSRDWIIRSARALWLNSRGEISQKMMERLRVTTLAQYSSLWSHSKMLSFSKAFLKYLTKTRLDTRYIAFDIFLEMPKTVKVRKAVTSRIVIKADIENMLAQIEAALENERP